MILTAMEIRKRMHPHLQEIVIEPFNDSQLNPNSYDLRLSEEVVVYDLRGNTPLDAAKDNLTREFKIPSEGITLEPGVLYLCKTIEYTETHGCVPLLEGKSSTGRLGIDIHKTAGVGDIGFKGNWTLEITVTHPVRVYKGMRICQIMYHTVSGEIVETYEGKYQGDTEISASKMYKDFIPENSK